MRRIYVFFGGMACFVFFTIIFSVLASKLPIPRGANYGVTLRLLSIVLYGVFLPFLAISLHRKRLAIILYSFIFFLGSFLLWPGFLWHYVVLCAGTYLFGCLTMVIAGVLTKNDTEWNPVSGPRQLLGCVLVFASTFFPFLMLGGALNVDFRPACFGIGFHLLLSCLIIVLSPRTPLIFPIILRSILPSFIILTVWNFPSDLPVGCITFLALVGLYATQLSLLLPLRRPRKPTDLNYWI